MSIDIVERLRFDAARCETQFSKGVAGNIEEAAAEIERLREELRSFKQSVLDPENQPSQYGTTLVEEFGEPRSKMTAE